MEQQIPRPNADKAESRQSWVDVEGFLQPTVEWISEYLIDESCYVLGYN